MKYKSKITPLKIVDPDKSPVWDFVSDYIIMSFIWLIILGIIYFAITYGKTKAFTFLAREVQEFKFGEELTKKLETFKIYPVKGVEQYITERASYAYEYSNGDKDFVLLLNAECGSWACGLHALKYLREGELWSDGYLCGTSAYYHPVPFAKAKNAYAEGNWKEQVEICHGLYKKGVRFYGWEHRHARGTNLIFNK